MKTTSAATAVGIPGVIVLLLFSLAAISGCSVGTALRTETSGPTDRDGQYRLYLYGCHYADDLENAAFIVDERSPYKFDLFVPDTSYRVVPAQSFDRAIALADSFLRCGMRTVTGTRLSRVIGPSGEAVAYQVLPLYVPYETGTEEAVIVNYSLKNEVVTVYIRLTPVLELKESFPDIPSSSGSN